MLLQVNIDPTTGFILPDNSVSDAHCSHFLEYLEHNQRRSERVRLMNDFCEYSFPGYCRDQHHALGVSPRLHGKHYKAAARRTELSANVVHGAAEELHARLTAKSTPIYRCAAWAYDGFPHTILRLIGTPLKIMVLVSLNNPKLSTLRAPTNPAARSTSLRNSWFSPTR
jgi:hypothetical protein